MQPIVTIFLHQMRRSLAAIAGWGISLALLAGYLVLLHDAFIAQQNEFTAMLEAYPPELMAAFGGTADLFVPTGFLNFTYFSYVVVLLGFLAVAMGGGLLAGDEERGRLELVVASPVSRLGVFAARLAAAIVSMVLILSLSWLGFVVTIPGTGLEAVTAWQLALPHFELLAFMLFFTGLALLLSQVLPSRSAANGVAYTLLLASYVLKVLLELDDQLASLDRLSPLHYVKGGYAIEGLDPGWMAGLLGLGLVFIILAAWRFEQRDLRVSGEGSWPPLLQKGA